MSSLPSIDIDINKYTVDDIISTNIRLDAQINIKEIKNHTLACVRNINKGIPC